MRTAKFGWLVFLLLLCFVSAEAAKKNSGPYDFFRSARTNREKLRLYFEWSPQYDNNVLKYSSFDKNNFNNGTELHPTPISKLEQWRQQFGLRGTFTRKFFLDKATTFSGYYRWNSFPQASIINYQSGNFQIEQVIIKQVNLKIAYNYLQGYPLRNYTDRDTKIWETARFDQNEYSFKVPVTVVDGLEIEPYAQWRILYYNPYFTEYDASGRTYGSTATYKWEKLADGAIGFEHSEMNNFGSAQITGVDPLHPVSGDDEYGNSSYKEDEYKIALGIHPDLGELGRIKVGVDYLYRYRVYTTDGDLVDDPFHSGRSHNFRRYGFEVGGDPVQNTSVSFRVETEQRTTYSPNPVVPMYKDYKATRIGMTMSYRIF